MDDKNTMDEFEKWLRDERKTWIRVPAAYNLMREVAAKYRAFKAKDKAVEPLEKTKRMVENRHYSISYTIRIMDNFAGQMLWAKCEPTYASAEAQARAYLEGLDDVREEK